MADDIEKKQASLASLRAQLKEANDRAAHFSAGQPGANDPNAAGHRANAVNRRANLEAQIRQDSEALQLNTRAMQHDPEGKTTSSKLVASGFGKNPLEKDIISGSMFGESVVGKEGLGRLGDSKNIQDIQERFQDLSKGFSDKETVAAKEAGLTSINAQQQAAERALQSRLGGAGVKGGAAGGQFRQLALGGLQQKANLERDLILADRDARVQGLSNLAEFTTSTEQFDIGQAAKEKNISLQAGLGFGALGAAERGAKISAEAAKAAAAAGSGGSGKK